MAAGTRIGTGYVAVEPDFSGFQREVERAISARFNRIGDQAGKKLGEGISRRVRSQRDGFGLASALAPLVRRFEKAGDEAGKRLAANIGKGASRARGDMFGLADALGEVEKQSRKAGRSAKVFEGDMFGVSRAADDAGRNLRSTRSQLRDWTAGASGSSRAARTLGDRFRGITSRLREVSAGARATTSGFGGMNGAMARVNRGAQFFRNIARLLRFPALITGLGLATQGLSALAAGFTAAASSVGPLAGALVGLPAIVATAAQAFGALKLATAGVGDTIKAALDAQIKGGGQAASAMGAQQAATDRVADSKRNLADAQRQAKIAQEDLTDARKDARRELEDMRIAAERSGTSEEAAVLQLRQLRQELRETAADPESSELDIRFAENAIEQAKLDLRETRVEAKRTRKDYEDATDAGVKGMPAVVAARRAEAEASRAEQAAQRDLARALSENTSAMGAQGAAATALNERMSQLPAAAQAFVREIISMKPKLDELRATAASGLFPGVSQGLRGLMGNFGEVKTVVGETAAALGGLAARAGKRLGGADWGRDLLKIGRQNTRTLNQVGSAGLNLADTFRHLLVAARPFVNWLGKGTVALTGWMKTEAEAGRKSGRLAAFFERTKKSMQLLGPILKGVGGAFLNIGRAARPLGNDILRALGGAAEGFRRWTGSIRGENTLRKYFADAKPAIFEMGRLVRDATKAFFTLGNQPGAAALIRQVRTELLPAVTELVGTLTGAFGKALVSALTSVVRLLGSLSDETGPLVAFVRVIGGVAKGLTWLIEKVPGMDTLVVTLFGMGAALKAMKFASAIGGLTTLAKTAVATTGAYKTLAANMAKTSGPAFVTAGQKVGQAGGTAAGTSFMSTMRGKVLPVAKGVGLAGAGLFLADGVISEFGRRMQEKSADMFAAIRAQAEGGKLFGFDTANLPGGAGAHLHEHEQAARKISPLLDRIIGKRAILAQADINEIAANAHKLKLTEDGRKQLQRTINLLQVGKNLGIKVDVAMDPSKLKIFEGGFQKLRAGVFTSMGDITKVSRRNMAIVRNVLGERTKEGRKLASDNMRATARAIQLQMIRSGDVTKQGMARVRRLIRQADLLGPTREKAREFGREWAKGLDTSKEATRKGVREMIREARKMPAPMRKVALEAWNSQITSAVKAGKVTKTEAQNMRSRVGAAFQGIELTTRGKSKKSADAVISNTQRMVNTSSRGFGILGDNANSALSAFGVDELHFKIKKFGGGEQKKQQGGFIVPGTGTGDKVRTALLKGSFVLNRKATEAFGFQRGGLAPVALEPGERVFHPDEVRRHGSAIEAMNRAVPRFQKGGVVQGLQGGGFPELAPPARTLANRLAEMGFTPTSTLRNTATHHGTGHAIDYGDSINPMPRLWGVLRSRAKQFAELFGPSFLPGPTLMHFGQGFSDGKLQADHEDHIHVAILGALKGALGAIAKLPRLALTGNDGPLRDLGQAAIDKVRQAGDRLLAKKAMVGHSGDPFSMGAAAPAGQVRSWLAEALRITGHFSEGNLNALYGRAMQESTGNPRAVNHSDSNASLPGSHGFPDQKSRGLLQTIPSTFFAHAMPGMQDIWNPVHNTVAAIRYMLSKYGHIVGPSSTGYAKGGLVKMVGDSLGVGTVGLGGLAGKVKGLGADVLGRFGLKKGGLVQAFRRGSNAAAAQAEPKIVDVSQTAIGSARKAISESMKLVRNPDAKKRIRSEQVDKLVGRLKAQFDLPEEMRTSLANFEVEDAKSLDRAERADSQTFDVVDANGEPVVDAEGRQVVSLGTMDGRTAEDWTRARLGNLLAWRNKLIDARAKVIELVEAVKARILATQQRIDALTEAIAKQSAKIVEQLGIKEKLTDLIAAKRRPNKLAGRIKKLSKELAPKLGVKAKVLRAETREQLGGRLDKVVAERAETMDRRRVNRREKAALGDVLKTLTDPGGGSGALERLTADRGSFEEFLGNIQGPGLGMEIADKFSGFPTLGQFSGWTFDAHQDLNRFSEKPPRVPSDSSGESGTDDERSQFLEEQLKFAHQRSLLKDSQFQTLRQYFLGDAVPFAGTFHTGDVVPGPVGQERMALVKSGEGVFTSDQMAAMAPVAQTPSEPPVVHVHVHDGAVDPRKIEVIVDRKMRGATRGARRLLGGV